MHRYHPLLELAPRDVVARAITREGMGKRPGESLPVYLDMRHVTGLDRGASIRTRAFRASRHFSISTASTWPAI